MLTVEDVNKVEFEKAVRGYRPQDVDNFLNKVADTIAQLNKELSEALKEKEEALYDAKTQKELTDKKLYTLAEKIEQYRADEDNVSAALLNAQRLSESMTIQAKENAQVILEQARQKAEETVQDIKLEYEKEEKRLASLKAEVGKFKAEVLYLYKYHIEQLNTLPSGGDDTAETPQKKETKSKKTVADKQNSFKEQPALEENIDINKKAKNEAAEKASATTSPESFEEYLGIEFED